MKTPPNTEEEVILSGVKMKADLQTSKNLFTAAGLPAVFSHSIMSPPHNLTQTLQPGYPNAPAYTLRRLDHVHVQVQALFFSPHIFYMVRR